MKQERKNEDSKIFYMLIQELNLSERVKKILNRSNTIFLEDQLLSLNLSNMQIRILPELLFE
ncbi:MAG: hypothetical protein ACTSRD_00145, partial [Promethearchaeota archaeon]